MRLNGKKISAVEIFYTYNVHLEYLNAVEREENSNLIFLPLSAAFLIILGYIYLFLGLVPEPAGQVEED